MLKSNCCSFEEYNERVTSNNLKKIIGINESYYLRPK